MKTFTCSTCGDSYTEEIATTDHDTANAVIKTENEVAADCNNPGSYDIAYYCPNCDTEFARETVTTDALGHTAAEAVVENEKAATCGEAGSYDTVVYCSVCKAEISRETTTVPATGEHTYVDGACSTCGAAEPVTRLDIRGVSRMKGLILDGAILVKATVAFTNTDKTANAEGISKEYITANGKILFWSAKDMPTDAEAAVLGTETSSDVLVYSETYNGIQEYYAISHGIPAKEYNDTLYYRTYIEVDGEVYYGDIIEYSVVTYCKNQLGKTTTTAVKMKPLLATMLNYGAAAQMQFSYNTTELANSCLQEFVDNGLLDAKYLTMDWNDSYLTDLTAASAEMSVNFQQNNAKRTDKTLILEGAVETKLTFAYNVVNGKGTQLPTGASVTFYYWTAAKYAALEAEGKVLSKENASYVKTGEDITQAYTTSYGYEYYANSEGIPAQNLGDTLYTVAIFTMEDGTEYCSGVTVYSPEAYASSKIASSSTPEALKTLSKWMVVYCETAYAYFNS